VMSRVATRLERELPRTALPAPRPEAYGFSEAVAEAACRAAEVLRAKAIVAFTQSGFSARLISSERPHVPVVALTPFTEIQRRLGLYWGVRARLVPKVDTTDDMLQEVESTLLEDGTVRNREGRVTISRLARTDKPVIMAVNGIAAGGGMSLALAGDLVVAAESARFTMAYSKIAASPDGSSSYFLPRLIGLRRSLELHYTNRVLSARE